MSVFNTNKNKFRMRNIVSLRFFVALIILITMFVPTFICGNVLLHSMNKKNIDNTVIEIKSQSSMLASNISASSYMKNRNSTSVNSEIEQLMNTYSARVVVVNSDFMVVKDSYSMLDGKYLLVSNVIKTYKGNPVTNIDYKDASVDVYLPIYGETGTDVAGVLNVSIVDLSAPALTSYVKSIFTNIVFVVALVSIILSIWLSHILVKPLDHLSKSIMNISDGAKGEHVENRTLYEYNRVAESVNTALDRIKVMDDSREEFVSNVSHELKTPMTSIKVLAESLVSQEEVPNELYREFMTDIVGEIDRENKIISDLLDLVKADRKDADINISTVNVNELVEATLKRLSPIANERNVELVLESFRPFAAEIDETKISQAVTNLVENAIKYNVENGWVHVSLNADHKYFYIKVADSGIGIPGDSVDKIFERFYRVDKARSRQTGGTGLGLAITKSIIAMHKGTIKVYSKENEGTTITIRIPLFHGKQG